MSDLLPIIGVVDEKSAKDIFVRNSGGFVNKVKTSLKTIDFSTNENVNKLINFLYTETVDPIQKEVDNLEIIQEKVQSFVIGYGMIYAALLYIEGEVSDYHSMEKKYPELEETSDMYRSVFARGNNSKLRLYGRKPKEDSVPLSSRYKNQIGEYLFGAEWCNHPCNILNIFECYVGNDNKGFYTKLLVSETYRDFYEQCEWIDNSTLEAVTLEMAQIHFEFYYNQWQEIKAVIDGMKSNMQEADNLRSKYMSSIKGLQVANMFANSTLVDYTQEAKMSATTLTEGLSIISECAKEASELAKAKVLAYKEMNKALEVKSA